MKNQKSLQALIQEFFIDHLTVHRGCSVSLSLTGFVSDTLTT